MTKVVLVTGITGFAGGYLTEALLERSEIEVHGLSRSGQWPPELHHLAHRARLWSCDMSDTAGIQAILREVQPKELYHLAGYAHVGKSVQEPDAAWAGNLTTTRSLYAAIERWGGRPRILYVGSGQIYGDPDTPDTLLSETSPLRPATPYAASKVAADFLSYQVTRVPGLDVVRARPFNHIGPRQSPQFAVAHFAEQVARIDAGLQPPLLETGNLSPRRDLTDVRDTVRAYVLLMERGRGGEPYNVGTGRTQSMQEVLDRLLALASVRVEVRKNEQLVRARDPAAIRVDAGKLRQETGWGPTHTLEQTLADMLAYWRGRS